eukprot:6206459-Pleurochrysis_carterae.AAC.1
MHTVEPTPCSDAYCRAPVSGRGGRAIRQPLGRRRSLAPVPPAFSAPALTPAGIHAATAALLPAIVINIITIAVTTISITTTTVGDSVLASHRRGSDKQRRLARLQ